MKRRKFLESSALLIGIAGLPGEFNTSGYSHKKNTFNLYWGDLHCHCGISYGRGSLKNAFRIAQDNRLDFCSIVGHSSWHDTPRDSESLDRLKHYIEYHDRGHKKLEKLWPEIKEQTRNSIKPEKFIPFLAFEWHSTKYGDYNVHYFDPEGEIVKANSLGELLEKMKNEKALVIPHHIGYLPGSRGIDWNHFVSSEQTPFVEVYSFHGGAVSDKSPYPYLLETGPRSIEGMAETGLKMGHHFGFMASTDNHLGFPGSYGEGLMACYSDQLTQKSLWEAFKARRVYAVTGDRIVVDFALNDAFMGGVTNGSKNKDILVHVEGEDFLDYIDLIKNGDTVQRFNPSFASPIRKNRLNRAKIRFEWGWGKKAEEHQWEGSLSISDGIVKKINPCFRPRPLTDQEMRTIRGNEDAANAKFSRITGQNEKGCSFTSYTLGNPIPLYSLNCALVMEVEMPSTGIIKADINGKTFKHTLAELWEGQRSHLVDGYLGPAVAFHRAVPQKAYVLRGRFVDKVPSKDNDNYYLSIRQKNDQWAWSSPIFVKT